MATRVKQNKDEVINVRCTAAQKELISVAAAHEGLGTGPWMLTKALQAAEMKAFGAVNSRAKGRG